MSLAERCLAALAAALLLLARLSVPVASKATPPRPLLTVAPLVQPVIVRQGVLGSGETLGQLFARLGVGTPEAPLWLKAVQEQLDPHNVPAGLTAESVIDVHGAVRTLRLKPSWRVTVVADRSGGTVNARREAPQLERELVVIRGTVRSSLFDAVAASGENEALALDLADLFQWDIDFQREVRAGDTFAMLVERVKTGGRTVGYGPVVSASYTNRGRSFSAVCYAVAGGRPNYYDAHGSPLRKQFLRAPLKFSRITSRYSMARLHPILGVRVPHWGIDYGAPVGTPVMATADGVVVSAGRNGGGGNAVELRHPGGFATTYMHLSRFASGIGPGARVEQGQVIGYVGSTGLSTGPHLDYRVTQNGRHLNPLGVGKDPAPPLPRDDLAAFAAWAGRVLPLLETQGPLPAERAATLATDAPVPVHG